MNALLKLVVLFCIVSVALSEPFDGFKDAFPNADISALYELPGLREDIVEVKLPQYAPCPVLPPAPDTDDVTKLRPGNIRVITAMGDSITPAMAAKDTNLLAGLKEYRGLSYCIGMDKGVTTLATILNSTLPVTQVLHGGSTGIGTITSTGNGFNAAISGAINNGMPGQAEWLVKALRASTQINYDNDWKLLTLWIGSNNLCDLCNNPEKNGADNFEKNVTAALNILYDNVPRLFVNLVANLDVSLLYGINSGVCNILHTIACPCVASSAEKRAAVSVAAKAYQARATTIANAFNARGKKDFAVVVQPFLINSVVSSRDLLSGADCFHPSAKSHQLAAVALWNNMLTPAASKKTAWNLEDTPICPTADSIFYTN